MEYIVPSLRIAKMTEMTDVGTIKERLAQLLHLEEDRFIARYHQQIEKVQQKTWHNCHIKFKQFQPVYFIPLYDSKFLRHPSKLCTHWLGPYVVTYVMDGGVVKLHKLDSTPYDGLTNGNRIKPYQDSCSSLD